MSRLQNDFPLRTFLEHPELLNIPKDVNSKSRHCCIFLQLTLSPSKAVSVAQKCQMFLYFCVSPRYLSFSAPKHGLQGPKNLNEPFIQAPNRSAMLGPQIWDNTLCFDLANDFKDFELEYMGLTEFFDVSLCYIYFLQIS